MQKILLIICVILTTTSANATQMCARRDTTVIPLDASVNGKTNGSWYNRSEWIWSTRFEYGRVYGIATCLSLQDIRDIQGNQSLTNYVNMLVTDEDEIQGRSNYYNGDDTNPEYDREFCYCKLTHPMSAHWVFQASKGSADGCSFYCADHCGSSLIKNVGWRSAMFNDVGQASGYIDIDTTEYSESISLN